MYIAPISKTNNLPKAPFRGINPQNIEEQLKKFAVNQETKDMFKGFPIFASLLMAEFVIFLQKNEDIKNYISEFLNKMGDKDIQELNDKLGSLLGKILPQNKSKQIDISKLTEEKPEREVYLKMTSYFPNLDKKYKEMLETHSDEPANDRNNFVLSSMENLFKMFTSSNEKLMYMKPYLDVLDKKYSNCLEGIAENLSSTVANDNGPMYYLVLLHNEVLSEADINRWAKYNNLSCDDFLMTRCLSDDALERFNKLRETNKFFKIKKFIPLEENKYDIQTYAFKLDFVPESLGLSKRLKSVSQFHEAVYGEIHLKEPTDTNEDFLIHDIQNEFVDNILKDRRMDATYNFIKFIEPEALKDYNYTSDEIKCLTKNDDDYAKIKTICSHVLMNLDTENPKFAELYEILNDEKMFGKILTTRHSKIRFITRFVLKDNYNPASLKDETNEKLNILFDELKPKLELCNFFCYNHPKGTAPQFYLRNSQLGSYVKITLNSEGTIHTIYEDFNKGQKHKSEENAPDED